MANRPRKLIRGDGVDVRRVFPRGDRGEEPPREARDVKDLVPVKQLMKGGDERMVIVLIGYDTPAIREQIIENLKNREFPYKHYHFVGPEAFFPTGDRAFSEGYSDELVLTVLQRWVRAWCNPNVPPFKLNKSVMKLPYGGVERVDLIHGHPDALYDFPRGRNFFFACIREVSEFLAGQGPTMLNWFMRPYIQNALEELGRVKKVWDKRGFTRLLVWELPVRRPDTDEERFDSLGRMKLTDNQNVDWKQASDEVRAADLEKIQKSIAFLQNALDGRGETLDGRELFKILYRNNEGLPAAVNRDWWYDQVRVSWDRHRRGGEAKELSWAGKMTARRLPIHCLFTYIENHFPRGAARIDYTQDREDVFEFHPVVRATKTKLLSQWVRPSTARETLDGPEGEQLNLRLAEYSASFLAGRVKLFKDQ